MVHGEILKAVFPLLKGTELAKCMLVCKQWRDIAQDDYFWKRLCSEKCPSVGKSQSPPTLTYYELFKNLCNQYCYRPSVLTPRLSFNDLEFYIDIWVKGKIIFSDVVPGPVLQKGTWIPPPEINAWQRPQYKMILPMEPRLTVPLNQSVSVSVLVGRKNTRKASWIVRKRFVSCAYKWQRYRPLASEDLDLSYPVRLFMHSRADISLLCMDGSKMESLLCMDGSKMESLLCMDGSKMESLLCMDGSKMEVGDVYGIEMVFQNADTEDKVLALLDMLNWK